MKRIIVTVFVTVLIVVLGGVGLLWFIGGKASAYRATAELNPLRGSDLKQSTSQSSAASEQYRQDLNQAFANYSPEAIDSEVRALTNYIETGNSLSLSIIRASLFENKELLSALLNISVPTEAITDHLALVNQLRLTVEYLEIMAAADENLGLALEIGQKIIPAQYELVEKMGAIVSLTTQSQ